MKMGLFTRDFVKTSRMCRDVYSVTFNICCCPFSKFNGKCYQLQKVFFKRSPSLISTCDRTVRTRVESKQTNLFHFFFSPSIWLLVASALFTECCITSCKSVICLQKHYFLSFPSNKQ